MRKLVAGLAFATVLVAGAAGPLGGAQAVTLVNGSFESGISPGSFTTLSAGDTTSITGWTVSAGTIDYIGSYWTAADGSRSLDMNGLTAGSISQIITGLAIGQLYRVSFSLAGNPDSGPTEKTLSVMASANSQSYVFDITGNSRSSMGWILASFLFTADANTALLTFASTVTSNSPPAFGAALDNVSVAATPLPAALPLFGTVLAGFGLFGWLRRRLTAAAKLSSSVMAFAPV